MRNLIVGYYLEHVDLMGYPPTEREIAEALQIPIAYIWWYMGYEVIEHGDLVRGSGWWRRALYPPPDNEAKPA